MCVVREELGMQVLLHLMVAAQLPMDRPLCLPCHNTTTTPCSSHSYSSYSHTTALQYQHHDQDEHLYRDSAYLSNISGATWATQQVRHAHSESLTVYATLMGQQQVRSSSLQRAFMYSSVYVFTFSVPTWSSARSRNCNNGVSVSAVAGR